MNPLIPVVALVLVYAAGSSWISWDARRKLLARIRAGWGRPTNAQRDMEGVADFFLMHERGQSLDDRTWNDLVMDDVFAFLDRTQSRVGQQMLYRRLRRAPEPPALDAFEVLVDRAGRDLALREHAQLALGQLREASAYYVHRLAGPDALVHPWWHVLFPLWTVALLSTLVLGLVWHGLFVVAMIGFIINFAIRIATGRRVGGESVWFRQVGPLMKVARALQAFDVEATSAITGSLKTDLTALRRLGAVAKWVSRGPEGGMRVDLAGAILEYINLQLLMDVNALYFASRELRAKAPQLLRVIACVGEIDAAIAVASFREGTDGWIRPRFVAPDKGARFSEVRHPLVDDAVPNSIALAPPHGVLVTGSNMSGKSTFLRTVGVNVVLAQSVNTCLARAYEAPVYQVRSCIGRADDLITGRSYYLVEVESVLALVNASESDEPHLFIFDELFRGTNAVERIAAGEAVLHALVSGGKPHVVLTATHDGELVDLLRDEYDVYHLGDAIGPDGLTFDYHLTPGPATSRNAIALLKLNGAPESLVARALDRAAALDKQRQQVL
jgi:hypothetical protein